MSRIDDATHVMLKAEDDIRQLIARNGPIHEEAPELTEDFYKDMEDKMRPLFFAYRYATEGWVRAIISKEQKNAAENCSHVAAIYTEG